MHVICEKCVTHVIWCMLGQGYDINYSISFCIFSYFKNIMGFFLPVCLSIVEKFSFSYYVYHILVGHYFIHLSLAHVREGSIKNFLLITYWVVWWLFHFVTLSFDLMVKNIYWKICYRTLSFMDRCITYFLSY